MNTKYIRKGQIITTINPEGQNESKDYGSINKAKKESHRLQMTEGGLGLGSVMRA